MADADKVWVPSKTKVWQLATVDAWKQSTVEVTTAEGQHETLDQAKAARWDPSHDGDIDDLAKMNQLHEAPLLTALGRRYKRDAIYTYTGDVLVSVNPYKSIPLLYDLPAVDDEEAFEAMDASRPHVYGIARRAQAAVRATRVNQSVVVSEESGAGKTEASKKVMAFLLALSAARKDAYAEAAVDVDAVLMVSNVILEAFGNAKTIRNDNSSRFGKYIRLVYDDDWRIAGARTDHFLLEKSRLASVDAGERSYHYFYQLVKAKALPDNSLDDFPLLVAGGVTEIDDHHTVDDAKEFDVTDGGLASCGAGKERDVPNFKGSYLGCFLLVSADLWTSDHLSERSRSVDAFFENARARNTHVEATLNHSVPAQASCGCSQEERARVADLVGGLLRLGALTFDACADDTGLVAVGGDVDAVARALGLDGAVFMAKLRSHSKSSARGSVIMIPYGDREAKENADALVKFLYGALFDWLLRKLNAEHGRNVASKTFEPFVGILDIFGFEILPTNSFEQLCINFANEMLQRQFNATVFERERAVYESEAVSEGLDPGYVAFDDNRDLVDVVTGAKPAGLFPILEEHGLLHRKPDDKALLRAYHDAHAATPEPRGGKPRAYAKPRFDDGLHFQLRHYAGAVDYDVSGWIVKNNDALAHDLRDAVEASDDGFLRHCLRLPGAPEAGAGRIDGEPIARDAGPRDKKKMAAGQTVSKKFRTQLEELVAILATTSPHYIKCIKPNSSKQPGAYSEQLVVKQLRCSGALEVVRIRREGLPTRVEFLAFFTKYEALGRNGVGRAGSTAFLGFPEPDACDAATLRRACETIVAKHLDPSRGQIGNTKVFLSPAGEADLQAAVDALYGAFATKINAKCAGKYARTRFRAAKRGFSALQSLIRGSRSRGEAGRRKKRLKDEAALRRRLAALRKDRDDAVAVAKNAGAAPDSAACDAAKRGGDAAMGETYAAAKAALDAAADAVAALRGATRAAAEAKAARDLEAVEALKGAAATRASSLEAASARLARVAEAAAALEKQGDAPRADVHAARKALDDALAAGAAARKTAEAAARAADDALAKATAPEDAAAAAGAADDAAAAVDARAAAEAALAAPETRQGACEDALAGVEARERSARDELERLRTAAVGDGGDGAPGAVAEAAAAAEACEATLANLDAARQGAAARAARVEALKRRRDRRAAVSAAAATTDAAPFRVDGVVRNKAMAAQVSAARDGVAAAASPAPREDDQDTDAKASRAALVIALEREGASADETAAQAERHAAPRSSRSTRPAATPAAAARAATASAGPSSAGACGIWTRRRSRVADAAERAGDGTTLDSSSLERTTTGVEAAEKACGEATAARRAEERKVVDAARKSLEEAVQDKEAKEHALVAAGHADLMKLAERLAAAKAKADAELGVDFALDGDVDDGVRASDAELGALHAAADATAALEAEVARSVDARVPAAVKIESVARMAPLVTGLLRARWAATAIEAAARAVVGRERHLRRRYGAVLFETAARAARARRGRAATRRGDGAPEPPRPRALCEKEAAARRAARDADAAAAADAAEAAVAYLAERERLATRSQARRRAAAARRAVAARRRGLRALAAFARRVLFLVTRRRVLMVQAKARGDHEYVAFRSLKRGALAAAAAARRRGAFRRAEARRRAATTLGRFVRSILRTAHLLADLDAAFDLAAEAGVPVDASSPLFAGDDPWALLTTCRHPRRGLQTLAHAAAFGGNASLFELLLPRLDGAALLARDRRGDTPLHCAARATRLDLARAILGGLDRSSTTAAVAPSKLRRASLFGDFRRSGEDAAKAAAKVGTTSRFGRFFGGRSRAESAPASARQPGVVHCGRMRKRKEGDAWKERWCVLSDTSLSYYGKKSDAKPIKSLSLRNASVKRSDVKPYAFEVHSAQMLQLGNKAGRMYFACEAPEDLFEWLGAFRETVALCHAYTVGARAGKESEIPNFKGSSLGFRRGAGRSDGAGLTPLAVAVDHGHDDLAGALVVVGADAGVKARDGRSPLDRCSASFAAALARKGGSVEKSTHAPLLGPPPLRHKCTYCRAIFDKLSLDGADKLHHPFLAISVRDAKGRDVERVQHATAPPLTRSGYLLFGKTWCLQSAVEDLDFGCFVLVELFDRAPSAKKAGSFDDVLVAWARLDLNAKLFESSRDSLEFFLPPFGGAGDAAPAHMFLSLDVYLAKLGDEGDARAAGAATPRHHRVDLI
ncbi:hypothetical protein JL720_951 [Aureococcus anophagefferens]|nr:hypothetical protein JL720_951 [Aureococcus anophagefferens]